MKFLKLEIKSVNKEIICQYQRFLIKFLKLQNIKFSYFVMPIKRKRITLLKSIHINKKAQSQFELKKYKLIVNIFIDSFRIKTIKNILLNTPKLISIKLKINL